MNETERAFKEKVIKLQEVRSKTCCGLPQDSRRSCCLQPIGVTLVGSHQTPILKKITFLNRELTWRLDKGSSGIYRYFYDSVDPWRRDRSYAGIRVSQSVMCIDYKNDEYANISWCGFVSLVSPGKESWDTSQWRSAHTKEELEQMFLLELKERNSLLESLLPGSCDGTRT